MAAVIRIEVVSQGGVQEIKRDVESLGTSAETAGKGFNSLSEIATGALRAIGTMGVDLALKGLSAVAGAISDGIADAKQNAILQAQTAAVIKSTGAAAGVSAQQVADYASSLSDAAGASLFGDDQVQESTNLLLTFTNIKEKSLEAATAISVDMAQALGGAPKDAAIQLGKALNDPVAGITALSRVGVSFTDQQKEQIAAMQQAGDMAGAQAVILAELNKEFGGSAKAAADATGGWSELNGRLGEAKEALGAAILPLLNQVAGVLLQYAIPAVEAIAAGFAAWLGDGSIVGGVQQIAGVITGDLGGAMQGIQAVVAAVLPVITEFWRTNGADIMATVQQVWSAVQNIIQTTLQIISAIVGPALQAIAGFISAHGGEIQTVLSNTWTAIKSVIDIALTLIQGVLKATLQIIQGDWSGAWTTIKEMSARIVQDLINALSANFNTIVTMFSGLATDAIDALSKLPDQAAQLGKDVVNGIIDGISGMAGELLGVLKDMAADALKSWKDAIWSHSPSRLFADEGGRPIVEGIIMGVKEMIPDLLSTVGGISDDLLDQVKDIGDRVSGAMGDALLGTASLDRAKAKAIGALKDISAAQQDAVQLQLAAASDLAGQFTDPKQAAAFFKQRSDQIFELARLRDQIDKTTDETAKARLVEQFNLIGKAQQAELQAIATAGATSPLASLAEQVQKLLATPNLPGILDPGGGIIGQLMQALPQLIALGGGNSATHNVSSLSNDNRQFSYTVNTTAPATSIDYATARALARV